MFRLIATNTQANLRPALLRKVRGNTSGLKFAPTVTTEPSSEFKNHYAIQISRSNSTKNSVASESSLKIENNLKFDQALKDSAPTTTPVENEVNAGPDEKTQDLLQQFANALENTSDCRRVSQQCSKALQTLQRLYTNDAVKAHLSTDLLSSYAHFLNHYTRATRVHRLSSKSDRDTDHYENKSLNNDIMLKAAVMDILDGILTGKIKSPLNLYGLRDYFKALHQCENYNELVELWEYGVNEQDDASSLYLDQNVLAIVLPVAYNIKRFSYEDISKIYDYNTKGKNISPSLLTSMGKIAILAGDNPRGLDMMEQLMKLYETEAVPKYVSFLSLRDLHLNFIGHCSDTKIAKHFFDKAVEFALPYKVVLKAPHAASMLKNFHEAKEPFKSITHYWLTTVEHYNQDISTLFLRSRYTILNNQLAEIFFNTYPNYSEEGLAELEHLISEYSKIRPVDETLINAFVTRFTWKNKEAFQKLMDTYFTYKVERSPVANRVCLKKMGEIEAFSNEEILEQWNKSLKFLDKERYKYIPIADWASLRDSTITSPYADARTSFYLKVLDTYKNYHQDDRACVRFARWWVPRPQVNVVAELSLNDQFTPDSDIDIKVPKFRFLKENVDYKSISKPIFLSAKGRDYSGKKRQ
ncbi:hypothetical protein FT663_00481 [Candidozyma haemuli var. vulneris]|uniref:ATPase expression protein 2, mitochondrial n=1 Tax=Candidozyma haemuli TaxID=45357 RepID=A0A2V1AT49_9ASCO|nr:hypothetical protein CXQ85_002254 [[Candida] haemuloni]KAF3993458.1 hypothetical protein FT662_00587 [[Candida] haemuloni var. vulneris]KAF3995428.1 hypothetical protein FT663_00481 [[Candida] haemuloni var. vulneris]PVH20463.1 hypothetical protein CXQ85_002254 [[Candida] haemuloni]